MSAALLPITLRLSLPEPEYKPTTTWPWVQCPLQLMHLPVVWLTGECAVPAVPGPVHGQWPWLILTSPDVAVTDGEIPWRTVIGKCHRFGFLYHHACSLFCVSFGFTTCHTDLFFCSVSAFFGFTTCHTDLFFVLCQLWVYHLSHWPVLCSVSAFFGFTTCHTGLFFVLCQLSLGLPPVTLTCSLFSVTSGHKTPTYLLTVSPLGFFA